MTKKDIIKQDLMITISVPIDVVKYSNSETYTLTKSNLAIVDLDKLAEFLAKYLPIPLEDLIEKK